MAQAHRRWEKVVRLTVVVGYLVLLRMTATTQDSDVAGQVGDSQGRPVSGVTETGTQYLQRGGRKDLDVQTDADGHCSLFSAGALLFFRKFGYRPLTYKRAANENTVNITLSLEDSGWKVPHCTDQQERQHGRYGDTPRFLVPRSAHVKKGNPDTDNWTVLLSFPGNRKEEMIIWSGPLLGGGFGYIAPKRWDREASTFVEWGDNEFGAIDVRGIMPDGRHWRSIWCGSTTSFGMTVSRTKRLSSSTKLLLPVV